MKRKWVLMGATSALGLGIISGGAVVSANAITLQDTGTVDEEIIQRQ